MALDREAIMSALYERIAGSYPWVTTGRRLLLWQDLAASDQPAVFVTAGTQSAVYSDRGNPVIWTLRATVTIYARHDEPREAPEAEMNALITAVEAALEKLSTENAAPLGAPGAGWNTTLGGLVYFARVDGDVETDEGSLGDQAVAIIPVVMLATG